MSIFSALGDGVSHAVDWLGGHADAGAEHGVSAEPTGGNFFGPGGGSMADIMTALGHYADDFVNGDGIGTQKPEGSNGSYAHVNRDASGWGVDYSAGYHADAPNYGHPVDVDPMSINGSAGVMEDDKGTRVGYRVGGGGRMSSESSDGNVGLDVGVGTFNSELSVGTDGMSAGASVNDEEENLSLKNLPFGTSLRLGVGAGEGAGARLHWGDDDHNGYHELGYGADIGPVSIDFKTEAHHRMLNQIAGYFR